MAQIYRYYEIIQGEKFKELKYQAIVICQSTAYSAGNLKKEDFEKFIDSLDSKNTKKPEDPIKKMKKMNLPIEEK